MRHRRLRIPLIGALTAALGALGALAGAPAATAADFPPNPTAKSGYSLDFQEEFNGTSLDSGKWLPYYLPHWAAERENAKARYTVANGVLTERLDQDTPAWNPSYDGTVKISSIQTYEKDWWHRFNSSMPNDHHEPDFDGYSTKYGYFETRAKLSDAGGGGHQALWLVGTEDTSSASANSEIDFIETFFSKPDTWRIAAYGWGDPDFLGSWEGYEDPVPSGKPTQEFHVYGMEWTPTQLNFYYDNQLYKTINDAPDMPMGMILGIYTDAGSGQHNDVWPKTWSVDYLRVWKKNGGYPDSGYQRLKNRQTSQYMHIENKTGKVEYGTLQPTAWSSQWAKETTSGGYTRYRNRWTGEYLQASPADGYVHHGAATADATTADWTEETTEGYRRFRNRATGGYAHTEDLTGYVQQGNVPAGYWTSQWSPEPAQ
ncbi:MULTISPECIES: glycoside hydrolase family 16 protein [unclassified Streptomyces]|uniref:glycoside hydrolase family 16 protein n=1 Tax=unclassified Streptomyces TaxID=2593676 RepID=UPI00225A9C7F|nr:MULTISPECIES: glycoside hydrolase family 16 protein [unclassified Streptomyces]MCX4796767.1 glycoside hydrolase family 16 protein [Streptomyces sp. NBC_01242]WSP55743.1 glycoside hydrolase family 16 protein [Streptomyces sp. NBC_01241]WSP64392.1 glycoside hydrolase family 16 protein [Streptomyces sp. NBC_01240]WSU23521.1 glycoside hydrolase family 16 protein [Streptomyces sp. NBC_01108]